MKKKGLVLFILLGIIFIPKSIYAQTYTRIASVGRSSVMDTSSNYYYTSWGLLSDNSLNSVPIPYSGGNYYQMGSEYSFPVTLVGDTSFHGTVTVPVSANTIYNYQLMNGLGSNDFHFGFHQNWGVYNLTSSTSSGSDVLIVDSYWNCNTYPHLGVAHNYCYYTIEFNISLSTPLEGAYNLNIGVIDFTGNRSAYYYSGYDSNGNSIEFPVASQNSGYPTIKPYLSMTSQGGSSGSGSDNTEEILGGIEEATDEITDQIQESYENLVKSQEVCQYVNSNNVITSDKGLNSLGQEVSLPSNLHFGITDYISIISNSTFTMLESLNSNWGVFYCFYKSDKSLNGCVSTSNPGSNSLITIPNGSSYFRTTVKTDINQPSFSICQNGNQAINDSLQGILDHNTDDMDFTFGDIDTISDTPVTDLLLLPLELITKITTSLGSGCMTWDLPFDLWGNNNYVLHMPCINLETYLGSTVWGIIDDLCSILMIYNIFRMLLRFYESWTSLNDTFDDVVGGVN